MAERSDLQENRLKSVENAIAQIQRQYGRGAIMRLGSREIGRASCRERV